MRSIIPRTSSTIRYRWASVAALVLLATLPSDALAYIDPVSGSIVLQVLAAGFFAGSLAFRKVRDRLSQGLRAILRRDQS